MRSRIRMVTVAAVAAWVWTSSLAEAENGKTPGTGASPVPPQTAPMAPPGTPSSAPAVATVPQPTPPPAAVPAPTPQELNDRKVAADIQSTRPSAVVERRVSTSEGSGIFIFDTSGSIWEQVCVAPCQTHLDRFSTYRVRSQNKIAGSGSFTLPQGEDALHLSIQAGDLMQHRAARAVTTIGTALLVVGVSLVAGNHAFSDESNARTDGYVTGAIGLGLLAAGIPWLLLTGTHIAAEGHDLQ